MADGNSVVRLFNDTQRQVRIPSGAPPGGPTDGDLVARVARLEETLKDLKDDTKAIREATTRISERIAGVEGRLTGIEGRFSSIPTSLQLLGFAVAVFVAAGVFRFFEKPAAPPVILQQPAATR